jgi:hypothetical protein
VDELATFGIIYLFPSLEGKFAQEDILELKRLPTRVPICDCPFPEKKRLYKLELNPNAI